MCAQPPLLLLHSLMSVQRVIKWRKVMKVIFTSTLLLLRIPSSFHQSILPSNSTSHPSHPSHLPLFHSLSPFVPSSLIQHTNLIPKLPQNNQVKLGCTCPTQQNVLTIATRSVTTKSIASSAAACKGSLRVGACVGTPTIVCGTFIHIRSCGKGYPYNEHCL